MSNLVNRIQNKFGLLILLYSFIVSVSQIFISISFIFILIEYIGLGIYIIGRFKGKPCLSRREYLKFIKDINSGDNDA
ncbi:hypothetical protein EGI31_22385 [Lacihabitans soyangensis]|uniref:Uncharacterized protein n=1 Tax=Lacihabitans soyangensis TaxID=869394 RepID=A0AAE3H6L3_9BACT|nr:hypothetical protein [Lacihabitans soyangensis]